MRTPQPVPPVACTEQGGHGPHEHPHGSPSGWAWCCGVSAGSLAVQDADADALLELLQEER